MKFSLPRGWGGRPAQDGGCAPTANVRGSVDTFLASAIPFAAMADASTPGMLKVGARLAHYEVAELIGAGGMGQVYRARDVKLQREVALKLLPDGVTGDSERRQRFEREARAVAALNHPGVVTIHAVEEVDGRLFLVMELVHGQPLTDVIPRGGLPVDRLLAIAVPLMEAVSAAHARGIMHRDLKPANVMVTGDGHVKVLDFGLAKPSDVPEATGTTMTGVPDVITGQGRILGTVAYMSPEQAEGKAVDTRSDVFSLGVMLYEMATGTRPFAGDTSVSTMAAIIRDTPTPVTDVNAAIPRELWRVIRRALAKDPDRRPPSAKELRNELEELRRDLESGEISVPEPGPNRPPRATAVPPSSTGPDTAVASSGSVAPSVPGRRSMPRWALAGGALVLAAAAGGAVRWWPSGDVPPPGAPSAARVTVESVVSLTAEDGVELFPSLSPDGRWLVYAASEQGVGQTDILLRGVGGQTTINLTKDSLTSDSSPAFSPDGERIVFRSERDGGGLFVMGRTGESVRRVSTDGFNPAWSPDGTRLAYAGEPVNLPTGRSVRSALWVVSVDGGEPTRLTDVQDAMQPSWSPDGQRIVYWGLHGDSVQRDLWTVAATGGAPVRLTNDAAVDWSPVWAPDGRHVYYASDGTGNLNLWRIGIDPATGTPQGEPEPMTLPRQGIGHLSLAAGGSLLAAVSFTTQSNIEMLSLDAGLTQVTGRRRVTNVSENTSSPSISPDGEWIAFWRTTNGQEDVWIVKRDGTGLRQVTNDAARDRNPQFTPDGRHLLFYSDRGGRYQIWRMGRDGGDLRQVTDYPGIVIQGQSTRDGTRAVANLPLAQQNILFDPRVPAAGQAVERLAPFTAGGVFTATSWSPDARFIVGHSLRASGGIFLYEVAQRVFRELQAQGTGPVWTPDGRHIVFRNFGGTSAGFVSSDITVLDVKTGATRKVFSGNREALQAIDVSPDGRELAAVIVNRQADIVLAKLTPR